MRRSPSIVRPRVPAEPLPRWLSSLALLLCTRAHAQLEEATRQLTAASRLLRWVFPRGRQPLLAADRVVRVTSVALLRSLRAMEAARAALRFSLWLRSQA